MTKLDIIRYVIKLPKSSFVFEYLDSYDLYNFNIGRDDWCKVKVGYYYDTQTGWMEYETKDMFKHYKLSSVERYLILQLFK